MLKILDLVESKEIPSSEMAVVIGGRYRRFHMLGIYDSVFGDLF